MPLSTYTRVSLSYIGAMLCSNWALSYMSYPAQNLAKSCKLIPVMLARILINHARYELREYAQVALITGGIALFMTHQPDAAGHDSDSAGEDKAFSLLSLGIDGSWIGLALCIAALALDGYTVGHTDTQPSAKRRYSVAC